MLELEVAENAAELCKSTVTETVNETVICRASLPYLLDVVHENFPVSRSSSSNFVSSHDLGTESLDWMGLCYPLGGGNFI